MNHSDIINLIETDDWMMRVLMATKSLNLPDWWIGAGFVRNKVWDYLHGFENRTRLNDVDVIYLDQNDFSPSEAQQETTQQEINYERKLSTLMEGVSWSVTNQARMHLFHGDDSYKSSEVAMSKWVETATCVGVKLMDDNRLKLSTPLGIDDLVNLILRPINKSEKNLLAFNNRASRKSWLQQWPKLKIVTS